MLQAVDRDGSGEVEFPEFVEIMTTRLTSVNSDENQGAGDMYADAKDPAGSNKNDAAKKADTVPFQLLATAYRRKKMMDAVMTNKNTEERKRMLSQVGMCNRL